MPVPLPEDLNCKTLPTDESVVRTVAFPVSGKVNILVFPLEAGALISKVPHPESAVNLIELILCRLRWESNGCHI